MTISATATSAGAASIKFDGLRLESKELSNRSLLIARTVVATPFTKESTEPMDLEYPLVVNL